MSFTITLTAVAVMLLYAVPGFVFVKAKSIKPDAIPAFAKVLMYVCQPCLCVYSFGKASYSHSLLKDILIFLGVTLFIQIVMLLFFCTIFRKKMDCVKYRVCILATTFGNCAFMGVPLLEAVMPDYPEAILMSTIYAAGMNVLGWTIGSTIITMDKKYISIKKALVNPSIIGLIIAIPLFVTNQKLPGQLDNMITLLGRMTTPLCMLVMGMRLATVPIKRLFNDYLQYFAIFIKQFIFPLLALLCISVFPVDVYLKQTMFILCATPVASIVLNFSEMLGEGQDTAANLVLLGTVASIATIPLMMLIY